MAALRFRFERHKGIRVKWWAALLRRAPRAANSPIAATTPRRCRVTSEREISAGTEAVATFDRINADFLRWKNRVPFSTYEDAGH